MRNILSASNRSVLSRLAVDQALLAFDFDGTLAPIVDDPTEARMRASTRDLLASLSKLYRVVIVSGRAQPDALRRAWGVGAYKVFGNHGVGGWNPSSPYIRLVEEWRSVLEAAIAPFDDVLVEDKVFSIAVHFRRAREKDAIRDAVRNTVASLAGARVTEGNQVMNILPADAPHKGSAIERERRQLGCSCAMYLGDDTGDEDVFALSDPRRYVTIRVGAERASQAAYYVPNQEAVDDLLQLLIALRSDLAKPDQGEVVG